MRLTPLLGIFVGISQCVSCSPPSVSDTDGSKAPGGPISADPGADVGVASQSTQGPPPALLQSVGLVEVTDDAGKVVTRCSGFAVGTDLALTSSLCATNCAQTRLRFLSSGVSDRSSVSAPARVSHCSSIEVQQDTEGLGFTLMRLALVDEKDAFPATKVALEEAKPTRPSAQVWLVSAFAQQDNIVVRVTGRCLLRYAQTPKAFSTHDCLFSKNLSAEELSVAAGGVLVDVVSKKALGLFDRTVSGAALVTTASVLLETEQGN